MIHSFMILPKLFPEMVIATANSAVITLRERHSYVLHKRNILIVMCLTALILCSYLSP